VIPYQLVMLHAGSSEKTQPILNNDSRKNAFKKSGFRTVKDNPQIKSKLNTKAIHMICLILLVLGPDGPDRAARSVCVMWAVTLHP